MAREEQQRQLAESAAGDGGLSDFRMSEDSRFIEILHEACDLVGAGVVAAHAARIAGLDMDTVRQWAMQMLAELLMFDTMCDAHNLIRNAIEAGRVDEQWLADAETWHKLYLVWTEEGDHGGVGPDLWPTPKPPGLYPPQAVIDGPVEP